MNCCMLFHGVYKKETPKGGDPAVLATALGSALRKPVPLGVS
jgi:hypothetical protein